MFSLPKLLTTEMTGRSWLSYRCEQCPTSLRRVKMHRSAASSASLRNCRECRISTRPRRRPFAQSTDQPSLKKAIRTDCLVVTLRRSRASWTLCRMAAARNAAAAAAAGRAAMSKVML